MAVLNINSINYIVGGETEKIINVDITSDDGRGNTFTECNKSFFTDEADEKTVENQKISAECHTHRLFIENEIEEDVFKPSVMFHDLFDFKDVAVKADYYKTDNTAVFGPKLSANPLGFVQSINGSAYGATNSEIDSSIIAFTNLPDTRKSRLDGDTNSIVWQYKLQSLGNLTYAYKELANDLLITEKYEVEETGELSTRARRANSILEYLQENFKELSATNGMEDLLYPKYNNNVIPRTFLYHLFVTNKKSNKSKWNEFNQGNIFGNVFSGKNFYDSKYSTAVSSSGETRIYPVRKYVKIGQTGGWPFLTYYDNKTWTSTNNNEDLNTDDDKVQRQGIISDNVNGRKYQHVETVQSINRFLNRGNHKSNMYSIRLNLNLNDIVNFENLSEEDKIKMNELLDTVKLDIKSSVRRISSKLAPAHTQLFKVYIDDQ